MWLSNLPLRKARKLLALMVQASNRVIILGASRLVKVTLGCLEKLLLLDESQLHLSSFQSGECRLWAEGKC